jgi:type IX secretion system PorP/SprF family membrane protein
MNLRKIVLSIALATSVVASVQAQDVHFTQFNLSPLTINPAFTGMHNGLWRANAIYRNQWNSVTVPYDTRGVSLDAPLYRGVGANTYLGGGIEFFSDKAGDGNLMNNTVMASVAYHKAFGEMENMALSFGMQGGFVQKSIDLSRLYFADQFSNGGFQPGTSKELLANRINTYIANAGLAWSQKLGSRFSYTLGGAAYNINQPVETFQKQRNQEVGLGMRYTGQLGMDIKVNDRFQIRPAVLYQSQANASEILSGTEFRYIFQETEIQSVSQAIFLGAWTRLNDSYNITGGVDYKGWRLSFGYDITNSKLTNAAANVNSFEIGLQYIQPNPLDFAGKVFFPCARF